jgi:hypothetical protein
MTACELMLASQIQWMAENQICTAHQSRSTDRDVFSCTPMGF